MRYPLKAGWDQLCVRCNAPIRRGELVYAEKGSRGMCPFCFTGTKNPKLAETNEPPPRANALEPTPPITITEEQDYEPLPVLEGNLDAKVSEAVNKALAGVIGKATTDAITEAIKAASAAMAKASEGAVREAVRSAQAQSRELVIKVDNTPPVKIEGAHYYFDRLVKLVSAGMHVYLWGPAGSGKTFAALQAAQALSRSAEIDTLDPSTFRSMVQGYMSPDGKPVHTTFTRCWVSGNIYVADECDNAPGHVQTLFNSALANGHAPLAWGNVAREGKFGFIGTGNTPGAPTRSFPDRKPMSAAFRDRLYFMHWPVDWNIARKLSGNACQPAPSRISGTCSVSKWESWVERVHGWADSNAPTLMVTPRASIEGTKALAHGEFVSEVADGLVFRGCDPSIRDKALQANPLPS